MITRLLAPETYLNFDRILTLVVHMHKPFDVVFSKRLLFRVEVAKSLQTVKALNVPRHVKSGVRFSLSACAVGSYFMVSSDKLGREDG